MRSRSALIILAALVAVLVPAGSAAASRPNQDDGSDVLPSGHVLWAHPGHPYPELVSSANGFTFSVATGDLQLDEDIETEHGGIGATVFQVSVRHRPQQAFLAMRRDGNLVFRAGSGRVIWQTHTAGTGSHNYAELLDSGSLVVRTAGGRTVWSSRTTTTQLTNGDHLAPGQKIVNHLTRPGTTLLMRTTGDLVLRRGTHRIWHTATRARGSRAVITRSGRLAVVAPDGRRVWRSHALGRPAVLVLSSHPAGIAMFRLDRPWRGRNCIIRPASAGGDCGAFG